VGSARVVVRGIGTAPVGYQNGFFGGTASKICATEFRLALGPNNISKICFDPKRPPACGGKASGAPRGCQSLVRLGPSATGGHHVNYWSVACKYPIQDINLVQTGPNVQLCMEPGHFPEWSLSSPDLARMVYFFRGIADPDAIGNSVFFR
jgi:hypothetical protein